MPAVTYRTALVALATLLTSTALAQSGDAPDRDPRNWPTVKRLVADRYEVAGRVLTLRVMARKSGYFNCGYRHSHDRLMAFTLLGGPYETLTGYMPKELGKILETLLDKDPWMPITVQIRFDPDKLSDICPRQVDILKWSQGWQYPPGSLTPGRPDATKIPTRKELEALDQGDLWHALMERTGNRKGRQIEPLHVGDRVQLTAGARLSTNYHCVYKGAARTHYSLRMHNHEGEFVHGYIPKTDEARELVDYVALHRDVLLTVQARIVKQALSHYCLPQLEITGWSLPKRAD